MTVQHRNYELEWIKGCVGLVVGVEVGIEWYYVEWFEEGVWVEAAKMQCQLEVDRMAGNLTGEEPLCPPLPSSKIDGSEGTGPSIAHRRDSYFDRMKDSILLSRRLSTARVQCIGGIRTDPGEYVRL